MMVLKTSLYDHEMMEYGPFLNGLLSVYYGIKLYYVQVQQDCGKSDQDIFAKNEETQLKAVLAGVVYDKKQFTKGYKHIQQLT